MIFCKHCQSTNVKKHGQFTVQSGAVKPRYRCYSCMRSFSDSARPVENIVQDETVYKGDNELKQQILAARRVVITSVMNGVSAESKFFETLKLYAEYHDCPILAIPTIHRVIGEDLVEGYDESIEQYILKENVHFEDYKLKILGALKISASIENPLAGLDPISKGASVIVGHPQVQLKTLSRVHEKYPAIVTTTGCVSQKNYSKSKTGTKADFNHSYSAVVVEFDDGFVHIRHLNYSAATNSMSDLDLTFTNGAVIKRSIEALVTGDEHVMFGDQTVSDATYYAEDSMVNALKPDMIVRHDVLDAYSISHHHEKNFFTKYRKYGTGMNSVEAELNDTIFYINDTTPDNCKTYIVQSNHNEHLTRWLNECDPKVEPWNAKVYHKLMYEMLDQIDMGKSADAFQLYSKGKLNDNVYFVGRNEQLNVHGIMMESHGDIGSNGSRGSRKQFSNLPTKSIIGHSHSPGIEKGCIQVGTSSKLKLEYNNGASSWHHAHCIVHRNGKRQLVFITNGKYRL